MSHDYLFDLFVDGQRYGPFTITQVREQYALNKIQPGALMAPVGTEEWRPPADWLRNPMATPPVLAPVQSAPKPALSFGRLVEAVGSIAGIVAVLVGFFHWAVAFTGSREDYWASGLQAIVSGLVLMVAGRAFHLLEKIEQNTRR